MEPKRREQFVEWTLTPAFDALSPAVAGIIRSTKDDKAMFPFKVDTSIGSTSWSWPEGPLSKQKLASYELFDPDRELFKRGAHMPLMIYMGGSNEARRSKDALKRRAANAARRGWTWDKRQSTKVGDETRDGGDHPKGTQKGRWVHTHGDGEPSDGQRKGGKGGTRGGGKSSAQWPWYNSGDEWTGRSSWKSSAQWPWSNSGDEWTGRSSCMQKMVLNHA